MKKRYGVKSLAILYGLYVMALAYALFAIYRLQLRRHVFHVSVTDYLLFTTLVFLLLFFLYYTFSRYNFAIVEDGEITFTSLNPFKQPVVTTISDIRSMRYTAEKAAFIITTGNDEMNIRTSFTLPDTKKLFEDVTSRSSRIEVSGTDVKPARQYKKAFRGLRIVHMAIIVFLILYAFMRSRH